MSGFYSFESEQSVVRLLHLTDHHLFSDPQTQLLGVPTNAALQAVVQSIQHSPFCFDLIVDTGDFIQHNNEAAYDIFAQLIQPLRKPLFWTVGNHDHEAYISNAFAAYPQIQPHKHILAGKHWQIVLLDSHIEGKPAGFLADKELQWLEQCLTNFSDRFTLIVLHHNVLSTNADWLDQHSLSNADELLALLQRFPNVKALLHGHIHQEVDDYWYDYRVLATPSTCIQFKPNCEDFTLDVLPQGWREIYLYEDGSIKTECKRLRIDKFLPDFTSKGY